MIAVYRGQLSRRDYLKLGGEEVVLMKIEKHEKPAEIPVTKHGGHLGTTACSRTGWR